MTQVRNVPDTPPVLTAAGPRDDGLDAPHWEGLQVGEVRVQRCTRCGNWIWAPQPLCPRCHSFDLAWPAVESAGAVYSWTRTWQPFTTELSGHVPFVVVLAELPAAGGRRLLGVLRDGDCADVRIGAPVRGEIDARPSRAAGRCCAGGWREPRPDAARRRGGGGHRRDPLLQARDEAALGAAADPGGDPGRVRQRRRGRDEIDGFVSYANDLNEGLAIGAALGVREIRWSTMVWGGGGGGVAAAVNAAAAAVASGQADTVVVYRGITEADDGLQSYGKGHFPPLLAAHGVLTPAQVCALRTATDARGRRGARVGAGGAGARGLPPRPATTRTPWPPSSPLDHDTYADSRSGSLSRCTCSTARVRTTVRPRSWSPRPSRRRISAPAPAYILSGVQGAGPDWSESAENNAAYTSAGFHPALVARMWEGAGGSPAKGRGPGV